jgi:glycosyltransferase involved in cell wall biosynthesis
MRILFVHQNFPGQFGSLAAALARRGHRVTALRQATQQQQQQIEGVELQGWTAERSTTAQAHPWAQDIETKLIRAEASARAAERLQRSGWCPDLIIGHPGWGEMLFLQHIWPGVPQLHYLEFHYAEAGLDVGFDPEFPASAWPAKARITSKKAASLLNLESMDAGLSPTQFQASTYPAWARERIQVIHDGIDTESVKPDPNARLQLGASGPVLKAGDPVITFVNRNLEPYRGFHRLLRALPEIQRHCPDAVTVIVGAEGTGYGDSAPQGKSWKRHLLEEVGHELNLEKLHFTGALPYQAYLRLLQVSRCHVYFTYPFVLGWSCLEAMAAGCLVVGSATAPVQEVIQDGVNGRLVPFFDQAALVEAVVGAVQRPERQVMLRAAARERVVKHYDLHGNCLPQRLQLVEQLLREKAGR